MSEGAYAGRRILVTGATGLVGSAVAAELLSRGANVTALVRDVDPSSEFYRSGTAARTRVINGRLEDPADVERAIVETECQGVFHLGAQAIVTHALTSPLQTFQSNIQGTWNLLEACRRQRRQLDFVVVASTDKAYGKLEGASYRETDALNATGPYDVSKACADRLAVCYHQTFDLPVAVTRCGNIYGPGDTHWNRIVPGAILAAWRKEPLVIRSDGQYIRDYIYLRDVVEGYLLLGERIGEPGVAGEAFNLSTGEELTVLQIARKVAEAMGGEPIEPLIENTARAEIRKQTLDAGKARRVLGWTSRYDIDSGLAETVPWYRDYLGPWLVPAS